MAKRLRDFGHSVLRDARKLKPGSIRADVDLIAADHADLLRRLDAERERNDYRHEQHLAAIAALRGRLDIYRDAFIQLVEALTVAAGKASDDVR
jgi:hypothetical protein